MKKLSSPTVKNNASKLHSSVYAFCKHTALPKRCRIPAEFQPRSSARHCRRCGGSASGQQAVPCWLAQGSASACPCGPASALRWRPRRGR